MLSTQKEVTMVWDVGNATFIRGSSTAAAAAVLLNFVAARFRGDRCYVDTN